MLAVLVCVAAVLWREWLFNINEDYALHYLDTVDAKAERVPGFTEPDYDNAAPSGTRS